MVFNEPVTGLAKAAPCTTTASSVGTVDALRLAPDDPRRVIARDPPAGRHAGQDRHHGQVSHAPASPAPPIIQLTGGSPGSAALADVDRTRSPVIRDRALGAAEHRRHRQRLVARMDELLSEENVKRISDTLDEHRGA